MKDLAFRKLKNNIFHAALFICALIVITPLFLVVGYLLTKGLGSISLDFFTQMPKPVGEIGGGMLHAIFGTLYMVLLAGIFSIPLGILCGVFLSEYETGKLSNLLRFSVDMMTGIPSIVIGIFVYILIVIPLKSFSALAGAIALSLIILPIVTRSTEEILKLIPNHIREAALALGLPKWKVTLFIILKGSMPKLVTGIMLAISRAAGETAPLLFTAFGSMHLSGNLMSPMASLPIQIYNYAISPFEDWQAQAWSGALTLIFIVLGLNLGARSYFAKSKVKKKFKLKLRK